MESFEPKVEKIYLEKKCTDNFDDRLSRLRNSEISRETRGLAEAKKMRDYYKAKMIERAMYQNIKVKELDADLLLELNKELALIDEKSTREGVHFLKCQFSKIITDLREGKRKVEFEAFGPYLWEYLKRGFDAKNVELSKTDQIGVEVMAFLSEIMPEARPVSLYDEYNIWETSSDGMGKPQNPDEYNPKLEGNKKKKLSVEDKNRQTAIGMPEIGELEASQEIKNIFRNFVEQVLRKRGIIKEGEEEGPEKDFVLISESEKIKDAEKLVETLKAKGLIEENGQEIWFQNSIEKCDDPRYLRINLRNAKGKWQCAALDASGFLDERNRDITHLVILPKETFEEQQDQVWEILHAVGFRPENYHNIFFETENPEVTPESVVKTLRSQIGLLLN